MKRLIGILILFPLAMAMGCARYSHNTPVYLANENCKLVSFKPGLEPEGFNGIKWETQLSTLKGMQHNSKDLSYGGIDFYLRTGDEYKLKNGKLIPIRYGFWRGKFYVGVVTFEQVSDFDALKESVFKEYGVGAKPFCNKEEYLWIGKNATMALRYDEHLGRGVYYIRSHSMEKQMN
jgi:hypothetical protein